MEKQVTVIIPNYNGFDLLKKNLPLVVKYSQEFEIIIIDDASVDNSANFIQKKYKNIKLIKHIKNSGFAKGVNEAANIAKGKYIVLLNSDVAPQFNFINNSINHFKKNKNLFAVGFMDLSHENGKIVKKGKGGCKFNNGFFVHFKAISKAGESLWVSGGSGIFDRNKFLELGGFDTIYYPFYWEDVDLSYRAWCAGYECWFEPKSIVDHYHQKGAISKSFSPFYIKMVSYRNQFIFIWKNIQDAFYIIEHMIWLPYYLLKSLALLDFALILGFFWAILKIPKMLLDYNFQKRILSDREIIKRFEKL